MGCETVKVPGGAFIACTRGRRPYRCGFCTLAGGLQCDWKLGPFKTCDAYICPEHALEVASNKHICPVHQPDYHAWAAQRPKVAVWNRRGGVDTYPREAVNIGRPSKWGNPFKVGADGTREEVVARFEAWLIENPVLLKAVKRELRGKDLLCWCAPLPCHGDVLLRIANE